MRELLVCACSAGILIGSLAAACAEDHNAYGPELEGFAYPYDVQRFSFKSQQQDVGMAYMDVKPASPNGRTVVLLHGANFCAATVALRSAIDEHAAAKTQAETATAALADVERRARDVAAQADALASERTRLDVASSANAARAQSLDDREAELNKREQEHQARVKANEDRIASVRASLA